jgi:hypothetical protein
MQFFVSADKCYEEFLPLIQFFPTHNSVTCFKGVTIFKISGDISIYITENDKSYFCSRIHVRNTKLQRIIFSISLGHNEEQ